MEIQESILQQLTQTFLSNDYEQGFLLGSTSCLEQLDCCHQVAPARASMQFYTPDANEVNKIIANWVEKNICFCGFIHSHVVEKKDLSQNDIEFAQLLFNAYQLPVLWFGLGIVEQDEVHFRFYSVTSNKGDIDITSVCWKIGGQK